jgi:hypothetical protein
MEKVTMNFTTDSKRQGTFEVCGTIKFLNSEYILYDNNGKEESVYPLGINATSISNNEKYSLFVKFDSNVIVAYKKA